MRPSSFLLTLLVVVLGCAVTVDATANKPMQPENPIIGILSEPVTHTQCVSLYQELLKLPALKKRRQQPFHSASSSSVFEEVMGQRQQGPRRLGGEFNRTLPPVPGPSGCIWSVYVDWLESSGIRVLPIPWDATEEKLDYVLHRVNGVLLAGGILGWIPSLHAKFFKVVQKIYKYVIDRNAVGDHMVLWGTCQGFEMLNSAAAGDFSIVKTGFKGMGPLMMQVNFTSWASESAIFGTSPGALAAEGARVRHYMATEPTTLNWHEYGIPPEEYVNNTKLNASGMRPLSTTDDVVGRTFTSSVESTKGPIFGVQFHPERVMFELDNKMIFHTLHAIEVSEYLGNFLVTQLRGNNHTFESVTEAEALLIANYQRFNLGYGIRIYNV